METFAAIDPASGERWAVEPVAAPADVESSITAVDRAFGSWRGMTVDERCALISRVATLHRDRADMLAHLMTREMGKPLEQARGEAEFSADIYDYYASHGPQFLADVPLTVEGGGYAVIRKDPLGPLLGIMPWNYPLYQVARFAGPNLVAGNTVLIKHAPQCPASARAIAAIFTDAGLPTGAYVNLFASHEQIEGIVADPRIRGVSLTGSERAGAAVAELAGRHLKKVVLELGGSDPFILLSTDDLDRAVAMAVAGRMENSGQACNASKRIIVVDDLHDAFVEKFTAAMLDQHPTSERNPTAADYGPLSSESAARTLENQVRLALSEGAALTGTGRAEGAWFSPAVLTRMRTDMSSSAIEFFGPVAQVFRAADVDDAVRIANATPFGLGAVVVSTDTELAMDVAGRLDVGMVFINQVGGDAVDLPFGGVKRSGWGRELGCLGTEEFLNKKLIRCTALPPAQH